MLQDRATAAFNRAIVIRPLRVANEYHLHEGESGRWVYASLDDGHEVTVPPDFYLREAMAVDSDDDGAIAEFIEAWGVPVDVMNRDILGGEAEIWEWMDRENLAADMTLEAGRETAAVELGWIPEHPKGLKLADALRLQYDPTRPAKIARLTNWDEVRMRVALMGYITHEITRESPSADFPEALDRLNAALSVYAPMVTIRGATPPQPTIYNAFAAQIANDIYEGTTLLTCQNETCPVVFTKQRGRAEYSQHRTKGVMYCSNRCAKAQAQRELRRRNRKAKNDA